MRNGDETEEIPDDLSNFIVDQITYLDSEHSQNEARMKMCVKEFLLRMKADHGNEPYYKKLRRKIYNTQYSLRRSSTSTAKRNNTITAQRNNTEPLQLVQHGFMEIPMSDPTKTLTMCMNCRMVPVQFRFPNSFTVGPVSIHQIQRHHRNCHTTGLDLTTTANALDEIIRIDFHNDVNIIKRDTFVNVIQATLIDDTLVRIFTKNVSRLIFKQRGIKQDSDDDDDDDTDPNVVPPNAGQLFPTTVDYDAVERALQLFATEIGNTSFQMDRDYPNFLHFLLMISPGFHASRKYDV